MVDIEGHKCPECGEKLSIERTYSNGNPIQVVKCESCEFMRIIQNHEVFSVNDLT